MAGPSDPIDPAETALVILDADVEPALLAAARKAEVLIVWTCAAGSRPPARDVPNELAVERQSASGFWDTELDLYLRSNGIRTVVLVGNDLAAAAGEAAGRRYAVVLPEGRGEAIAAAWSAAPAGARNWQLETKQAQALTSLDRLVDPRHSALVIIDMQNDFCHPDGVTGGRGHDVSHNRAIIPTIARLLEQARARGLLIVHVQAQYGPTSGTPGWLFSVNGLRPTLRICLPGSWGAAQVEELAPRDGEEILIKHRYSAFVDTRLDHLLRSRGIRTLVVTGTATQACVESTVRQADMLDYYVVVAKDGVGARGHMRHMHEASLEVMATFFATVVPADEILAAWQKGGPERETERGAAE